MGSLALRISFTPGWIAWAILSSTISGLPLRTTWSRSTPLTLLGRLENKGYVKAEKIGGRKQYTPLLTREDASLQEAKNLLQRAYQGSVTLMVNCLNKKEALPKEELDQLYELLKGLEDENHA